MRYLTGTLLGEPDAFVMIRAVAPGHIYAELVRENRDPVISEGSDVEGAVDGLNEHLCTEASEVFW